MADRHSGGRKRSQTASESAADLKVVETQAKRQASRGLVKEIAAAMQSSGNANIKLIITKAGNEWTGCEYFYDRFEVFRVLYRAMKTGERWR
ncbi:hypothetical protein Dsin_019605 [Dipteronia sinensis]|uniref:Uncharacterized protein n=1 Tax=Dipteronia sinensis TaxID=43782 RepID=A0AAE0E466_9ROSI|nr:hypothetical protein Dsin_019605 [Dipteronia sinensis]